MNRGYSRCSTNESKQDIGRQVRELKEAGAELVYMEYEHGDAKIKSQQQAMFTEAEPGDSIIVLEVSRLARSTQQLCEIIEIIRQKHLRLVIVGSITLDCRDGQADPMSEAFLQMAGVFSQLELAMIRARVRSGMANAAAKGYCRQTTSDRRQYPFWISAPLSGVQEWATECVRAGKGV